MEVFFIKYRKLLTGLSVIALLYPPFEIYKAIESFSSDRTAEGIAKLVDASIMLFCPVYLLIKIRRANENFKEQNATK